MKWRLRSVAAAALVLLFALAPFGLAQDAPESGPLGPDTALGQLYRLASQDFRTAARLRRLAADDAYFATNPGAATAGLSSTDRRQIVSMARNPDLLPVMVEAATADLNARSRSVPNGQVFDAIVIGAGIHEQIAQNALAQLGLASPNVLTVERTNVVASNFALMGSSGSINSPSRPTEEGVLPVPGKGNLNEFADGLLQTADVSAQKIPPFHILSDVAAINRVASPAPILFGRSVVSVEEAAAFSANPPAKARVTLDDGSVVYTDNVVFATGFGNPALPKGLDPDSREILEENAPSSEALLRGFAAAKNPYRDGFSGKTWAIWGFGDSGKVDAELLLRLAPDEAYGDDNAQTGLVKKIYVLGLTAKDCLDYIAQVRVRYAGIAGGIKSSILVPVPGKGKAVSELANGQFRILTEDGQTLDVDGNITATGYVNVADRILRPLLERRAQTVPAIRDALNRGAPIVQTDAVESLQAALTAPNGSQRSTAVAQRLRLANDAPNVFFIGGATGEIVPDDELKGVPENKKSIFNLGKRTRAFARQFLAPLLREKARGRANVDVGAPASRAVLDAGSLASMGLLVPEGVDAGRDPSPLFDLALEAELRAELRARFDLPEGTRLDLRFDRPSEGTIQVGLRLSPTDSTGPSNGLSYEAGERLRMALAASPRIVRNLARATEGSSIRLSLERDSEGRTAAKRMAVEAPEPSSIGFVRRLDGDRGTGSGPSVPATETAALAELLKTGIPNAVIIAGDQRGATVADFASGGFVLSPGGFPSTSVYYTPIQSGGDTRGTPGLGAVLETPLTGFTVRALDGRTRVPTVKDLPLLATLTAPERGVYSVPDSVYDQLATTDLTRYASDRPVTAAEVAATALPRVTLRNPLGGTRPATVSDLPALQGLVPTSDASGSLTFLVPRELYDASPKPVGYVADRLRDTIPSTLISENGRTRQATVADIPLLATLPEPTLKGSSTRVFTVATGASLVRAPRSSTTVARELVNTRLGEATDPARAAKDR